MPSFKIKKILLIQTAFIGDAVLVTALIESLKKIDPTFEISILVRKGNEVLFKYNPHIQKIFIWDKKKKWVSFYKTLKKVRKEKFDVLFCIQRHFTMGLFTILSKAKIKVGFCENPFSFFFDKKVPYKLKNNEHEIERNLNLAKQIFTFIPLEKPKLYFSDNEFKSIKSYQSVPYVCMAPSSVWKTKQLPISKWVELIEKQAITVYLLGGKDDETLNDRIINLVKNKTNVINLAGKLDLLESTALMKSANMNYVNDSAPMHLCSSVDAPVTVFYCSTVPEFGFKPLSNINLIVETKLKLPCRPCGIHGKQKCPKKHFSCGHSIDINEVSEKINYELLAINK